MHTVTMITKDSICDSERVGLFLTLPTTHQLLISQGAFPRSCMGGNPAYGPAGG